MSRDKMRSPGITLVLDAYNVIHAVPQLERNLGVSLEAARTALLQICADYQIRKGNIAGIVLVFDGRTVNPYSLMPSVPVRQKGIEMIFSDEGQTADDRIIELLEDHPNARKICVISNDNYVRNNARAYGAAVVSVREFAEEFYKEQKAQPAIQSPLTTKQFQEITNDYKNHLGIKD